MSRIRNRLPMLLFLLNVILTQYLSSCSRILVVMPLGLKSHFIAFEPFFGELVNRGHDVTLISPNSISSTNKSYRLINITENVDIVFNSFDVHMFAKEPNLISQHIDQFNHINSRLFDYKNVCDNHEVSNLIKSDQQKFDLVIVELFDTDATLGFGLRFNAPIIALSSSPLLPWANSRFANPENPSYIPVVFTRRFNTRMNFWQRTYNALVLIWNKFAFRYFYTDKSQTVAEYCFRNVLKMPSLIELGKRTSLILVNTHYSLHGSKPSVQNVIQVGGLHVKQIVSPLPKDLKKFIDESKHGVIYFCMGSMLRSSTLPEEKRLAFIKVFSKLPQRVLWKWETETMPDKPENVKLVKWMPQRDVLAHPNVKLFISHGGLLGTTEAVHSGVPILGIPFYGDQGVNIEAVKANGAGLRLDFNDINVESFSSAINQLLNDPKYKLNAVSLSERFRDRPQTPLETAVYWTEYVIRHKGAPHLRSAAVDLAWYQYLLLDVIVFLLVSFVIICFIVTFIIKRIYRLLKNVISPSNKSKSDKRKKE